MLGSKLKSWMESKMAKVRSTKSRNWERDSSGVPSSCSNDTSIVLGGGSSMGSFAQNLSSPDTGYSTDGYSPRSHHPPLPFMTHILPPLAVVSKTTLLTQSAQSRDPIQNQLITSLISSSTNRTESPRKPPRMSKIKQQLEQLEQEQLRNKQKNQSPLTNEVMAPHNVRHSVASSGDSGQGTLGSNRNSGESFTQYRFPNISEEPRETEILSDWAPTDEDVDEGVLTPTPTPPAVHPLSPIPKHITNQYVNSASCDDGLPKAYETLQLLNQCNHVFPLPSCTGPRCLQARLESHDPRLVRKRAKAGGPFGFLKKFFRRKSSIEREFPENSRGKHIRTGPTGYWLTPTPNSFRKRNIDSYVSTTIPKGVKSDIIRLPQTTPTTLATPTLSRQSPFLNRCLNSSNTASPASVRFKPPSVTPIRQSPRPVVAFALEPEQHSIQQQPSSPRPLPPPNTRIQLPSFNNYSPIHRLVVTTGVHHHHHRPAPESPLVRIHTQRAPLQSQNTMTPTFSSSIVGQNPRYQYIPSSNQNSPILCSIPRRLSAPVQTLPYYASPLVQNTCRIPQQSNDSDRIYERVEGTEVSDEGDGEGGDYEWDVSIGESDLSVSQGQESNRSRQSQISTQTFQAITPVHLRPIPEQQSIVPPMAWGTRLSEMEIKLLEKEADLKYKKLLLEAEVLLRQFTMEGAGRQENNGTRVVEPRMDGRPPKLRRNRDFGDECPQSDPLRRKNYDCWALKRLQQEMALSCASPPVLHRSRRNLLPNHSADIAMNSNHHHHHHPSPSFRI